MAQYIVIALATSTAPHFEGCQIIVEGDVIIATHSKVFGPASKEDCEKWITENCGGENNNGGNKAENVNIGETKVENIENIENVEIHKHDFFEYLPHIITGFIILIVSGGIAVMIYRSEVNFFTNGDAAAARGLITFLVAIVTIAIALILTLSAVSSNASDFKERFALGKEILTILIGVLGTIIGFYFGSADKTPIVNVNPSAAAAQTLQIVPLSLSNDQVTSSAGTVITAGVSGGKPPYKYKITFDPDLIEAVSGDTTNGVIQAEVKKPAAGFDEDKEVTYQIEVTDADNKTSILSKDKVKKFVVKKQ